MIGRSNRKRVTFSCCRPALEIRYYVDPKTGELTTTNQKACS